MSMLLARHSLSEANIRDSLAFGSPEARLILEGRERAKGLGQYLIDTYGIDLAEIPVAVSELFRSPETAIEAGFKRYLLTPY